MPREYGNGFDAENRYLPSAWFCRPAACCRSPDLGVALCGLTGFWGPSGPTRTGLSEMVRVMADSLAHRGPDDSGEWGDPAAGLAFGFRRLAILDLSPHGRQPMTSACGRYVLVFNGEVYNYSDLRIELVGRGRSFRGSSDTEVVLEAIAEWGLEAALRRFVGMFALAVWDRQERNLSLARDRLGIKPLYYGWMGTSPGNTTFLFGSEPKALRCHPDFKAQVDRGALSLFLRYNVVPAPYSIYQGLRQLTPGCLLTLRSPQDPSPRCIPFWSLAEVVEQGQANPFPGDETEAIDRLETLLKEAVRLRLVSDVPLGAFLSGGIDSSLVVALMQAQSDRPVRTFSIGFHEQNYDETGFARQVAARLGTAHTDLYLTPRDALAVIPELAGVFDEPFADWSQIPTLLLSRLTRRDVTVSLSGDGGDEIFGGYTHYTSLSGALRRLNQIPASVRARLASPLVSLGRSPFARRAGAWLSPFQDSHAEPFYNRLVKVGQVFAQESPLQFYRWSVSHWRDPAQTVLAGEEPPVNFDTLDGRLALPDFIHQMMFMDTLGYLPDDILTKVDRASMSTSLEARVPLLDHRVVEFAWSLPLALKVRAGSGKWILRRVLDRYIPSYLVDRPKMGFSLPLADWLRGPLRLWAEAALDEKRLARQGFFRPGPIRQRWLEHLAGRQDWLRSLWNVLMFQTWLERWME